MDDVNLDLSSDDIVNAGKRKLRAVYSVVETPVETDFPDEATTASIADEIAANMLAQAQRDYDALPRWKQRWYMFLTKTGLWRVLNFLGRYTPSALRLRWYYWRHRKELREEYGE